ncbi:hypothetical protein [Pseudomonas putida]|uniref:hypothetical protein n=1 Tax=Pseudomonas putida TaxID=303 RepID=UPI0031BA9B14
MTALSGRFSRAGSLLQGTAYPMGVGISEKSYRKPRSSSVALRASSIGLAGEAILPTSLRILIADEQHFNRLRIERSFNQLGHFGVAPVQSLEELLVLVEYASEPFDLLVVNAALAGGKLNLLDFCLDNDRLRCVLIYDGQRARLPAIPTQKPRKVQVSHAELPDAMLLEGMIQGLIATSTPGDHLSGLSFLSGIPDR